MSVSRVLIGNDGVTYRFLKVETRPDGSLLILQDRDRSVVRSAGTFVEGRFVSSPDQSKAAVSHAKITCHTTGEVRYYNAGIRRQKFFIEPLFALSRTHTIGFFSIPQLGRLDRYDGRMHFADVRAVLDLPSEIVERVNFVVELAPCAPGALDTYGVALSYETYAMVVRLIPRPPIDIPSEMSEHFVQGVPASGRFASRQVDIPEAELQFHQTIHGKDALVFREKGGAYVVLAQVPMRQPPRLSINFTRSDLKIEIIPSAEIPPSHKVRFWICEKGRRNKTEDLRQYIQEIELSAEI